MEKHELKKENEIEKYLRSGNQTMITPEMLKLVENVEGNTREKIEKIIEIIDQLKKQNFDKDKFRKRTAAKILEDGYITGCTDSALAYIALARAKGIPSKYVETIDVEWLKDGGAERNGHVYSKSYCAEEEKWIWINPRKRRIDDAPQNRVIYKEGLDSWDIGIEDEDSLNKKFDIFRDYWLNVENKK